jgi:selenide,water dikinase
MEYLAPSVEKTGDVDDLREVLMYDPQTSGGLLISVKASKADKLMKALEEVGVEASVVGEVTGDEKCKVRIK